MYYKKYTTTFGR